MLNYEYCRDVPWRVSTFSMIEELNEDIIGYEKDFLFFFNDIVLCYC